MITKNNFIINLSLKDIFENREKLEEALQDFRNWYIFYAISDIEKEALKSLNLSLPIDLNNLLESPEKIEFLDNYFFNIIDYHNTFKFTKETEKSRKLFKGEIYLTNSAYITILANDPEILIKLQDLGNVLLSVPKRDFLTLRIKNEEALRKAFEVLERNNFLLGEACEDLNKSFLRFLFSSFLESKPINSTSDIDSRTSETLFNILKELEEQKMLEVLPRRLLEVLILHIIKEDKTEFIKSIYTELLKREKSLEVVLSAFIESQNQKKDAKLFLEALRETKRQRKFEITARSLANLFFLDSALLLELLDFLKEDLESVKFSFKNSVESIDISFLQSWLLILPTEILEALYSIASFNEAFKELSILDLFKSSHDRVLLSREEQVKLSLAVHKRNKMKYFFEPYDFLESSNVKESLFKLLPKDFYDALFYKSSIEFKRFCFKKYPQLKSFLISKKKRTF